MALRGDLDEAPESIYLRERRDSELPSFLLEVEDWHVERLSDPDPDLLELVADIEDYMDAMGIRYEACEPVLVGASEADGLYQDAPAVRVTGWLGRYKLIGLAPSDHVLGLPTISAAFPAGVPSVTGDALRPTGYGSAYDIRHPAAQEALRNAAVVLLDMFPDGDPEADLLPFWPEDARDLIDDELVRDLMDTVFLVGWKLGQPTRLELSSSRVVGVLGHVPAVQLEMALSVLEEEHGGDLLSEAAANPEVESDEQWHLSWREFFEALPQIQHPLAVDLVLEVVGRTMDWALGVVGHALPGGQLDPIREAPKLLDGAAALREHLEDVRAQGLVHDERLTRHGINHPQFGRPGGMRFLAKARFGMPDDRDFAKVQADFNQSIYDFSPLPVSLGLEAHPDEDGSVLVNCALSAPSVEEAFELSHEVITQVRWRVGLSPIDLEAGDDDDEIQYELEDLRPDSSDMDESDDT
jgi:hypothetical protein